MLISLLCTGATSEGTSSQKEELDLTNGNSDTHEFNNVASGFQVPRELRGPQPGTAVAYWSTSFHGA